MTKVFLASGIDGNILMQGLINDGEMLKFGVGGKYLGKEPVGFNLGHTREVDLVSIVNVENELELAYVINNEFKKYPLTMDIQNIIVAMNKQDNMVFIGRRVDNVEEIYYNQYIYGFTKGTLVEKNLLEVLRVEG